LTAEKDSEYRIIVRKDNMVTTIVPGRLMYSSLPMDDNHYYFHNVKEGEKALEVEFELKNILN